ncbi:hypothetical protein DESC_590065 [Desulfosarcina cetonica]|nr:hypothetical protein DESC_590065 [Desulfosarcina cetonica]
MQGVEQAFGHAGTFHKHAHEEKERHGQKGVVLHQVVETGDEEVEDLGAAVDPAEHHGHTAEHEGRGITEKDPDEQGDKHQQNHQFGTHGIILL